MPECYVSEDDQLVLSCHVMGHPQPKITWLKDADKLPPSPRFQTSITEEGICESYVQETFFATFKRVYIFLQGCKLLHCEIQLQYRLSVLGEYYGGVISLEIADILWSW